MAALDALARGQVHGLPVEVTSFVGRRCEVAEVKRLLSGGARLVTLTGVGGVGKTRLAVRVGEMLRRAFADGVWLVELAHVGNPDLLVPAISEALQIRDHSARSALEVLIDRLRDEQTLVILDNCEHLTDACAVVVEALLESAPGLRILATSRQSLGVAGEQIMAVPTLPVSAGDGRGDGGCAAGDAVRLFAERAGAVLPGFSVTEANREVVERICQRLDGIPLGIELAAVRLRALSLQQLLERLDDRFGLLTSGSRAVLPRHQTLRALIDWSYALCTDAERLLWARVSVFSGGLDLAAAEEVCAGEGIDREEVIDLVSALVDKSVLIREDHPTAVRYRLLETIRQYGHDRLTASGAEISFRRRHRDYYRDLVTRAGREWFGPDQVAWFARLRLEHGNIRSALDFCLNEPAETGNGLTIATALRFYWIAAGFMHEGRRWLDELLAADSAPAAERGGGLCVNARLAVLQSDFTAAEPMLAECRWLAVSLGSAELLAQAQYVSGLAALIRRDLDKAVLQLSDALERHRKLNHHQGVANSLMYLATAHSLLNHSQQAVTLFEECRQMCETRGEHWFGSYTLSFFGIEVWRQGDAARAVEMERQSIRLKQPFDDQLGIALCIEVLAFIAADGGDADRAARLLGASREIWRSVGGPVFGFLATYRDHCQEVARTRIGTERFDTLFREGTRLAVRQAIAFALDGHIPPAEPSAIAEEPTPLTHREFEVARLVAQGRSNKEIAATLVIAQRTAEGHVEHILTKLGFTSRAQIATWITEVDQHAAVPPQAAPK